MLRRLFLLVTLLGLLNSFIVVPARASIDMVPIAKTMMIVTTSQNSDTNIRGNVVSSATVTRTSDTVRVLISATNSSSQTKTITIRDTYRDVTSNGFSAIDTSTAGWYDEAGVLKQAYVAAVTGCDSAHQLCASADIPSNKTYQFRYTVIGPQLPNYKSRLIAFPVQSDANGATAFPTVDIGYVLFVPDITKSIASSSFSASDGYDIGITVAGITVSIAGETATQKTSDTFAYMPYKGVAVDKSDTVAKNASGVRKCISTNSDTALFTSRSGSCLYSAKATVTVVGEGQEDSSVAQMLVLPSSAIVGSVFVNPSSGSSAANILLPGSHVSSGVTGSTSSQNVAASIDSNSVSGWKAGDVYKNVYANTNIQRLLRNADTVLSKNPYLQTVQNPIQPTTFTIACAIGGVSCNATSDPAATATFTFKATVGDLNCAHFYFDLSSATLGSCPNSKPDTDRKNGFVLYVDGNLDIEGNGVGVDTLENVAGGTVIVNGNLTINNITIDYTAGQKNGTQQKKPLAFIVVPKSGLAAVNWSVGNNNDSKLNSVVFFVPTGTFAASKTGSGMLTLLGSIVADNVNLGGVSSATTDTDKSSISIQTDPLVTQFPPPGTSSFGGGASASDTP